MTPRLLDIDGAAAYLSVGTSFVRALVRHGDLVPVRPPSTRGVGESRRLLFDQHDLDALVERWKAQSSGEPNAALSQAAIKGWHSSPVRRRKEVA
jgi:hypothetical protein